MSEVAEQDPQPAEAELDAGHRPETRVQGQLQAGPSGPRPLAARAFLLSA